MTSRLTLGLALVVGLATTARADEPAKPDSKPKGDGHAVAFKPGDPKSPLRPRVSPKGTQVKLTPTDLPKVEGKDHLVGRIEIGPKEFRGEGQLIALARTEADKPYDLLFVDTNRDGKFTDEKAITTKPNLNRNNWWSSFAGTLKVAHAEKGEVSVDYPVAFWAVVEKPEQTPDIIRYSRTGFMAGTVSIGDAEYDVVVSDGDNDGVIGKGDFWAVSRTKNDDPIGGKFRVLPDFCWAGGKAWKLEMDGTAGAAGKLYPFDPGVTQAEDDAKRDLYKADREAPRAEKAVAFETDHAAALKKAAADKKPVFVKFETDWCGPCKVMSTLVFTARDVAEAADGVVCVVLDGDKEKELVKQYKVEAYPTGVFLDSTGKEVGRFVGYRGVKAMTEELKKLKK